MKIRPQTVTQATSVQCYGCGWKGILAEAKQSIYLDMRPGYTISASQGGNGKNWRCPQCKSLIFFTRNDHTRKDIAPEGHQFKHMV